MKTPHFAQRFAGIALLAALLSAGCGDDNDNGGKKPAPVDPTLSVSTDALTLGAAAGSTARFSVQTDAAWRSSIEGGGFTLVPSSGTGKASVLVTASAANTGAENLTLGTVTITAEGVVETEQVVISQSAGDDPVPAPDKTTITVDFAQGPAITQPALPASSAEALTGRHEYTVGGYAFAVYADPEQKGKFFWTDNAQYGAPEPNKGLYFSKEGAYVEFPALKDRALREIVWFFNKGAGETPAFDLFTAAGAEPDYSQEFADDGTSMTYTLLDPAANTSYRLTVMNSKNAQVSKFALTYR